MGRYIGLAKDRSIGLGKYRYIGLAKDRYCIVFETSVHRYIYGSVQQIGTSADYGTSFVYEASFMFRSTVVSCARVDVRKK